MTMLADRQRTLDSEREKLVAATTAGQLTDEEIALKTTQLNREQHGLLVAQERLRTGRYGRCVHCAEKIAEPRLHALPFAIRCKNCEEQREQAETAARSFAARTGAQPLASGATR